MNSLSTVQVASVKKQRRQLHRRYQNMERSPTSVSGSRVVRRSPSPYFTINKQVLPVNEHEPTGTIAHPTRSTIGSSLDSSVTMKKTVSGPKPFLFDDIDRRQLYTTIDAEKNKKKQSYKRFLNCSSVPFVLLVLLLALIFAGVAVVLVILLAPKTTVTTSVISTNVTTTTTTTSTTSTSTSTTTTTTSTTTSTTTTSTTSTATTTAATVTITSNVCTSTWSGITMIAYCNTCPSLLFYYHYSYNYTAIGTLTRIAFAMQRQNGYFALDDISVRDFSAPNTEIIINGGFELGNLNSWNYCNQNNGSDSGGVKSNSSSFTYLGFTYFSNSGSYYYVGGNNISTDYISQTFATNIGDQYSVTFAALIGGGGPGTNGYFFLGV